MRAVLYLVVLVVMLGITGGDDMDLAARNSEHQENTCKITGLTVNYEENPIGIDHTPLFGWRMESDVEGQQQTAYQIIVAKSQEQLEKQEYVWDKDGNQ